MTTESGRSPVRQQLEAIRRPLLRLHKSLLAAERMAYERKNGTIQNGGALLQLVIGDPWFAWLRPMSGLIVLIDEHLEAKEERPAGEAASLLEQARVVTSPDDHYRQLIQEHPDVAIAQLEVRNTLAS